MRIDSNISALSAFGTGFDVTANNIANVNTEGFHSSRVALETGPKDQGVRVAAIQENTQEGPPVQSLQRLENPETNRSETQWSYVEGSNTDLAREMVNLAVYQNAYEANVTAISAQNETEGTLLNLRV